MLTRDFYFELPKELIAQRPSAVRGDDRLLRLGRVSGAVEHLAMDDLPGLIAPGTLMLLNDSRVRRSRVFGAKEGGSGRVEFMFLTQADAEGLMWRCMVRGARRQRPGMRFVFPDGTAGTIVAAAQDEGTEFRTLRFSRPLGEDWFERNGHVPLPPYIRRGDNEEDSERYQNVYASRTGSAACPTAGLHFTDGMLRRLRERGVDTAFITLHVGLGTFLPVRSERVEDHAMHEEVFTISDDAAAKVNAARGAARPVLAVGTTTVRALESAADGGGRVRAGTRSTRIFIYPGYKFRVVDQLFTNFHTPESTLLMLVSAFAGRERVLSAYSQAVERGYRFFSYGDAMLIQ